MSGKINVTFVDDIADTVIGTVDLSPESLPPSFEQDTRLSIGDADWSVISAQPSTHAEFIAEGSLTLRLRKLEVVNPAEMRFSIPTFFDLLPELGVEHVKGTEFIVTEDDWRQIEFVSVAFDEQVKSELAAVLEIHKHHSEKVGWTKVHVRKEPLNPISEGTSWADLLNLFPNAKEKELTFGGKTTLIESSFSLELDSGFYLYGLKNEDQIIVLALDGYNVPNEDEIEKFASFLKNNKLQLVDWCRCRSIDDAAEVVAFFER